MYVFNESGKGYWMDGFGCLRAEGENRPSRPAHVVVLNDQGGAVLDVSNDVTATLRAQEHGHQPVICFEPGIAKREGGKDRFVKDKCTTLRANMGDNQPAVCYGISRSCLKGGEASNGGMPVGEDTMPTMTANGTGAVCYAVDSHPTDSRMKIVGGGTCPTITAHISKVSADGPLVLIDNESLRNRKSPG